jgi:deoxyribonuclease IV
MTPSSSKSARLLGAHTINNGGIHMAVRRAGNAGMTAMQLFTAIPKYYGDKSSINPERVARFKAALKETSIRPENIVVHAAYVLSEATPDDE